MPCILSYTYVHLLVLISHLIAQSTVMDHLKTDGPIVSRPHFIEFIICSRLLFRRCLTDATEKDSLNKPRQRRELVHCRSVCLLCVCFHYSACVTFNSVRDILRRYQFFFFCYLRHVLSVLDASDITVC
jgi:hypothetical protein